MENDYKDLFCVNEKCSAALAAMSTGCDAAVVASEAKHKARADSYLGYCRNPVSVITRASGDSCSSVRSRSVPEGLAASQRSQGPPALVRIKGNVRLNGLGRVRVSFGTGHKHSSRVYPSSLYKVYNV